MEGLQIGPELQIPGYSRDAFRHWSDADSDRCNTREEVLIAESRVPAQVDPYGCKVIAGEWLSVYDGVVVEDPAELDVDHVVALKEAWESGAAMWTAQRREQFANDLTNPEALIAVTSSSNRSKSDKDPAEWMPPLASYHCEYITAWTTVKRAWGLSVDQLEMNAITAALDRCSY